MNRAEECYFMNHTKYGDYNREEEKYARETLENGDWFDSTIF